MEILKKAKFGAVLILLLTVFGGTNAYSATDYFLKIDGVEGESKGSTSGSATGSASVSGELKTERETDTDSAETRTEVETSGGIKSTNDETKTGSAETKVKSKEGEKLETKGVEPDEIDFRDDDDDGDSVPTADEDISASVKRASVRGWDEDEKEAFLTTVKAHAELKSGQDLENFATGVLLKDENVSQVEFNPKEVSVSYRAKGKILWFIPVNFTEKVTATEEDQGDINVKVKLPWYKFMLKTEVSAEDLAKKAKDKNKGTIDISAFSFGASNQGRILLSLVEVLKAEHSVSVEN